MYQTAVQKETILKINLLFFWKKKIKMYFCSPKIENNELSKDIKG